MKMVEEFEAAMEFLEQFENKRQSDIMEHLNATSGVADGIALNSNKLPEKSDPSQASYIEKFLGPNHSQRFS